MRSGNLPVRYEVTNEGPPGKLAAAMTIVKTTIVLEDARSSQTGEQYILITKLCRLMVEQDNTLTGVVRAASLNKLPSWCRSNI